MLRLRVNDLQSQIRAYNLLKRQPIGTMKKEVMSAAPAPEDLADSA